MRVHDADHGGMRPSLSQPIIAGDALQLSFAPFAAGEKAYAPATHSLALHLRGAGVLDIVAPAPADPATAAQKWELTATGAQTAALPAGAYAWTITATDSDGARTTIGSGQVQVYADLALAAPGYDARTTAQVALEEAELALASFKGSGGRIRSYTIAGRTITFDSSAELVQICNYWRVRVATEQRAARAAAGLGDPSKLHVRWGGY